MDPSRKKAVLVNGVLIAAIFCITEYLLAFVSAGFPWFDFHAGNAIAENVYAIQPAEYFGVYGLTFVVVLVNYLIAYFISRKQWKKLLIPAGVIVIYLLWGYMILQNVETTIPQNKEIKVAILDENIPPDIKWDENNGNMLVARLLDLNRDAVPLKPDIILWSESAIPWTYRPDDDLVNEVLKITAPANVTHMMGINTEDKGNEVNNSAYCILPDGKVAGRYDKQFLLSLIEKPVSGALIPFFSSKGFSVKNDEAHSDPINTPYGKAGVMICNESSVPASASNMANKGAEFLFNMSNDGWFSDTYIVHLHFYNARLRAVETRKDVAVNCNNGISGLIKASGSIEEQQQSADPFIEIVNVNSNRDKTLASAYPSALVVICFLYPAFLIIRKIVFKGKA
jgi:apolipoprotein N-acyltransferase